jgi:hypothetical protein
VAPTGFGQLLPPLILEFFGSANSTIGLALAVHLVIAGHSSLLRRLRKLVCVPGNPSSSEIHFLRRRMDARVIRSKTALRAFARA